MKLQKLLTIGLMLVVGATAATAQDAEKAKLLAKRAAEADAYRKLAEAVYGLQLNARTYVKDFVTENDEIRSDVDQFIKGVRLGNPTFYEDGSAEVPAEVTVAKVVETLREAHSRHYKGNDVKTEDFTSITQRIDKQVIKVIGMGAPRIDIPPDLPQAAVEALGPAPEAPKGDAVAVPDIWKKIGPQARMMAIRAAHVDAQRRLAERIKGLRLNARTQVRDFVTESDVITTELNATLVGAQEVGRPYLHHDELIAEVTLRVPTEQVITTIKELHTRHYKGDDVKGTDIENIVKTVIKKDFEATGMGVPPKDMIEKYERTAKVDYPDWVTGGVEAEGTGTDPEFSTPQGRLKAARAAEMDARRKLAERIAGLRIDAQTTVKDFSTQHDEVRSVVDAVIVDAEVVSTKFGDDSATVVVRLPGMRVWSTFSDARRKR